MEQNSVCVGLKVGMQGSICVVGVGTHRRRASMLMGARALSCRSPVVCLMMRSLSVLFWLWEPHLQGSGIELNRISWPLRPCMHGGAGSNRVPVQWPARLNGVCALPCS